MKILSLDVSSKTGWAFFLRENDLHLEEYGLIETIKPNCEYPRQMLLWSKNAFVAIKGLIEEFDPDQIIIEETSKGSKNHLSQKFLEFVHFQLATYIVSRNIPVHYFQTGTWRFIIGAKMNKTEKENNKKIKKAKEQGVSVVKNEDGKRIGRITKKHINVRLANETFGLNLKLKNNNEADAIGMGIAYDKLLKTQELPTDIDDLFR